MEGRIDPYHFNVGRAWVEPETPITAGGYFTKKIIFEAGEYGTDEGGRILICKRLSCDMQIPQFSDPTASGYVTVVCSNPAVGLSCSYLEHGYLDDWRSGIAVRIARGYLNPGDRIEVILGDTGKGGPGIRCQTFPEKRHTFKVIADIFNTNYFYEVTPSPEVEVVPGMPDAIQVVADQRPVKGQPFNVTVRVVDSWGNPTSRYQGKLAIEQPRGAKAIPREIEFREADQGVKRLAGCILPEKGIYRLKVSDQIRMSALSAPISPRDPGDDYALYWADMHGQTRSTVGTGTVEEYYRFAHDKAGVDVAAWQGNDLRVRKEDWDEVKTMTRKFNQPNRFVTFLGYEWSGLRSGGGDHNIYYAGDDGVIHRSSHARLEDLSDQDTDRFPLSRLWDTFRGRKDVLAVAHVGGRAANLDFFDPEFVRFIEIHSHHGTFEWLIEEALSRGYKVGFIAASDDHTGRLGLVYPNRRTNSVVTFDVRGGLAGIYARALTREAVWEALQARRTYATSGERIMLKVTSGSHWMGEEIQIPGKPVLDVEVLGTAPLLDVELKRGIETIYRHPVNRLAGKNPGGIRRIRVQWSGVSQKSGRDKKVRWNGTITMNNGAILSAQPYAMDQFDDEAKRISNVTVKFSTHTSGDLDGVLLDVQPYAGSALSFHCEFMHFDIPLEKIGSEPTVFPGGGCNIQVLVSEVGLDLSDQDAVFSFTDEDMKPGCQPYWIRVTQLDGGQAWSSPIYVTRKRDTD